MVDLQERTFSLRELNIGQYIAHYRGLLWRRKWYLLISVPVFVGLITYALVNIDSVRPKLPATILIGLDNSATMTAVEDIAQIGQKKIELIRGRQFLAQIVDRLSLRLVVNKFNRSEVFESVSIDSTTHRGKYHLHISSGDKRTYRLLHWGPTDKKSSGTVLGEGSLASLISDRPAGISMHFKEDFLDSHNDVWFFVIDERTAVDNLLKNLTIEAPARGQDFFTATLEGTDYVLTASTLNAIGEQFVQQNLAFRKRRTKDVMDVLEKQLQTASEQLSKSESALRVFMSENPTLGLSQDAQQTMSSLLALESNGSTSGRTLSEARRLASQLRQAQGEDRHRTVQEALLFLSAHENYSASIMRDELAQLMAERQRLQLSYAPNHPLIQQNEQKISGLENRTLSALQEFINISSRSNSERESSMRSLSERLRNLPQKELRLAELQRKRDIDSEIYSQILNRYNQAKVTDAAEVADVFIMDPAIPPIPSPPELPKALLIGILFGLAISVGPVIALDALDQTARTESELTRLISLPVLESVPVITVPSSALSPQKQGTKTVGEGIDPRLITSDYAPNYINELFRSLRTKLLLGLHHEDTRSMVFTSLNMDEGKSLISSNVAVTLAQQGLSTLLIDGDLRRGMLHFTFAAAKNPGLSDFIFSTRNIDEESIRNLAQTTHVPNLSLITSGANVPNPSELLSSDRFVLFAKSVMKLYDVVILDTPPVGFAADAVVVNALFSKYVIVARAGTTNIVDLRKRVDEFPQMKQKTLGLVLNRAEIDRKLKYYRYSNYYY